MKKFISFGEIGQYRDVVKKVVEQARYVGYDEETNTPVFDYSIRPPRLSVTCSEKIHGTNAAVSYNLDGDFWIQSRSRIITPGDDNAGCAFFCESHRAEWQEIIYQLSEAHEVDLTQNTITVYFEWCGGNIQAKSAATGLDKRAIIFQHFKITPMDETIPATWEETCTTEYKAGYKNQTWVDNEEANIFNIMNFDTWELDVDFNLPMMFQNQFVKLVEDVIEPNSPVGRGFGVDGNVGEGMVCTFMYKGSLHRFKVKGEKHAKSKVKKLKVVDEEGEIKKIEFANYACSAIRLEQAWQTVFGIANEKGSPEMKHIGEFIKAVMTDIVKEELDIMVANGLEPKVIASYVAKISRDWFIENLNKEAMAA